MQCCFYVSDCIQAGARKNIYDKDWKLCGNFLGQQIQALLQGTT